MPSVIRRRAGWRRHVGRRRLRRSALAGAARRAGQAAGHDGRADRAGARDDRHRPLRVDAGDRRQAERGSPRRSRRRATFLDAVPDKVKAGARGVRPEGRRAPVADAATTRRSRRRCEAIKPSGMTATGDAIEAALQSLPGKAPAAIVLLSDGKSVRGTDPLRPPRRRPRRARSRSTPSRSAPTAGDGQDGSPSRPTRRRWPQIARITGGQAFTAGDHDEARPGLQAPRLAGRHREAQARGDHRLRRRRARADGAVRPRLARPDRAPHLTHRKEPMNRDRDRSRRRGAPRARGRPVRVQARRRSARTRCSSACSSRCSPAATCCSRACPAWPRR